MNFRKIKLTDAPAFAKWRSDEQLGWQVGWELDPKKWNIKNEQAWIRHVMLDKGSNFWACLLDGKIIGRVGIYHVNFAEKSGEVSILIGDKSTRSKGYGKHMLDFAIEQGYKKLDLKRIYATIFTDNEGAIRFFESNGFKKSGNKDTMNFKGQKREFLYFDHIK